MAESKTTKNNNSKIVNSPGSSLAQGTSAKSSSNSNNVVSSSGISGVDLKILVSDLDQLRVGMRAVAQELEHDEAVTAVGKALKAAEIGDEKSVAGHLKTAGKWALGIAEKLALSIATEAIKDSMR